jgi:hypothetical protein
MALDVKDGNGAAQILKTDLDGGEHTPIQKVELHRISADETGNSTKILLGAGATFTGNWEDVTDFATVAVAILGSLATDGTLYIESSQDGGVTVNSVPFNVADTTFDLPHIWNVVESHIRIRYTNGATPMTGTFQLQTKYSNGQQLGLLQNASDTITGDTDVQNVRALVTGEVLDDDLQATGSYDNVSLLGNKALKTGIPPTILYQVKRPTDPTIPSGTAVTVDPVLNTEPNVIDSGWLPVKAFGGGSLVNIITDQTLRAYIMNASDTSGNNIQGNSAPLITATSAAPATIGAPFFDDYFRILVENTSGSTANEYSVRATGQQIPAPPVFNSIDQQVFGFFPAPLNRSVTIGQDPNGDYVNKPESGVDSNNTTTTPLGISGVFTGTWTRVDLYAEIRVSYDADVNGADCLLEFSSDGVNVERSIPVPPQPNALQTNFGAVHTLNPIIPYFRVKYTNGLVAQTAFSLTTTVSVQSGGGLISRSTQVLNKYDDVRLQRIINTPAADRNFGLLNYQRSVRVRGRNGLVGAGGFETLWSHSANWVPAQTAETIRVAAGGDAADDAAGAGARTVDVTFLDANWEEVTETLTLAGAAASAATSVTGYRVLNAIVKDVGTYHGSNTGEIVIENSTTNDVMAHIPAGEGKVQQSIYTVPASHTMYITDIVVSVGLGNSADVKLLAVPCADDFTAPTCGKFDDWGVEDFSGATPFPLETYLKFEEKTDVFFEAIRITGGGNARVSIDFKFILIDDTV